MKKILISLSVIGVVAAIVIGATTAYFSDTETSVGNTFTAGTIDISLSDGDGYTLPFTLEGMKPSETGITVMNITNEGTNPVNVFKKITNVVCEENGTNDAEVEYYSAVPESVNWKISGVIDYDMKVEVYKDNENEPFWWQVIYHYDDGNAPSISQIAGKQISLGMIPVGGKMVVTQSYHMDSNTGNWAQSDKMTFDIEIKGEQLRGYVHLENKDQMGPTGETGEWYVKWDETYGDLSYNMKGPEFVYDFTAQDLSPNTPYSLIYYADPWPGSNGTLIDTMNSDNTGKITKSNSVELNMDLPVSADANSPEGAKIWLVPSSDYDSGTKSLTAWNPGSYLFETGLIT